MRSLLGPQDILRVHATPEADRTTQIVFKQRHADSEAFKPTGKVHWETLLRARAIETQSYVIAAAQVGAHNEKRVSVSYVFEVLGPIEFASWVASRS